MHENTYDANLLWQEWQNNNLADSILDEHLRTVGVQVLEYSEFVTTEISRNPELLQLLLANEVLTKPFVPELSLSEIIPDTTSSEQAFMVALRRFRKTHMIWLYWRDLSGDACLEETFAHISWLADTCLNLALTWAHAFSCQRYLVAPESFSPLLIIAMGKYGAMELNVSSDIDLIFCYDDNQQLSGRLRALEPFYTQIGRKVIQLLDQRTADGFVFRVDMRLRPYGDSGPLVMSQSAMESYYLEQGRDWERFAMIKARFVTGEESQIKALYEILKPFVYRRYVDFSVLEAPRKMKRLIESEIRRRNLGTNIKLGAGGIREIEFFAQALQLIHGGREPRLQKRQLLPTLETITELDLVENTTAEVLEQAYRFLRKLEHRLQAYKDEQTQVLPETEIECLRLAKSMGYNNWLDCAATISLYRERVNKIFSDLFASDEATSTVAELQFEDLWLSDSESCDLAVLEPLDDSLSKEIVRHIGEFKTGSLIRNMGPRGSKVLDELMPKILEQFVARGDEISTLQRLTSLLHAIARRTAYLDLLNENSGALQHLMSLCARSALIADQITAFPYILDELLDPQLFLNPPSPDSFQSALWQHMSRVASDDIETRMDVLREFKQTHILRMGAAMCANALDVVQLGLTLSSLAETIIAEACAIAWHEVVAKYGQPDIAVDENTITPGFAVVAYGKLGGLEMGFNSDLDLVFIYSVSDGQTNGSSSIDNRSFYVRLAQKVIHILSVRTRTGVLYEVDMRLRPSGNSGLLVSHIDAFEEYQKNDAWTWEHQALIRARCIATCPALTEQFNAIRQTVLSVRSNDSLQADVSNMRQRMRDHLLKLPKASDLFDLKQSEGGIVDIEFLVQYWVLKYAGEVPDLVKDTRCLALLKALEKVPKLSALALDVLAEHYADLQTQVNYLALEKRSGLVTSKKLNCEALEQVQSLWLTEFGAENVSG